VQHHVGERAARRQPLRLRLSILEYRNLLYEYSTTTYFDHRLVSGVRWHRPIPSSSISSISSPLPSSRPRSFLAATAQCIVRTRSVNRTTHPPSFATTFPPSSTRRVCGLLLSTRLHHALSRQIQIRTQYFYTLYIRLQKVVSPLGTIRFLVTLQRSLYPLFFLLFLLFSSLSRLFCFSRLYSTHPVTHKPPPKWTRRNSYSVMTRCPRQWISRKTRLLQPANHSQHPCNPL